MAAFGGNESCPNCGARMAADQRYCLNCGHRRGDPRLPFMDAVVFMESQGTTGGAGGAAPPPPLVPPPGGPNRWNANAALIAGVATLVLAIGVGFLIGRTGHDGGENRGGKVEVVQVGGGPATAGTEETATPETSEGPTESSKGGGEKSSSGGGKPKSEKEAAKAPPSKIKEGSKEEEERAKAKTNEVLHTANGVELETEVEVGGKCKEGTAGCENGKFEGNFFGE
jgi:hypothetical protein